MKMRIGLRELREFVRLGRVDPAEAARVSTELRSATKRIAAQLKSATASLARVELLDPVTIDIPLEVITENRTRAMNPFHRRRMEKRQRAVVRTAWIAAFHGKTAALPVVVTFTRHGRRMDGHDSLPASFKHITDEVTELLGLTNDDTREVRWQFAQEPRKNRPKGFSIRIEQQSVDRREEGATR